MDHKDEVASQSLSQHTRDQWTYTVRTRSGLSYTVAYALQPFGFVKEVLARNSSEGDPVIVWNREFKVGENLRETWIDRIRQG